MGEDKRGQLTGGDTSKDSEYDVCDYKKRRSQAKEQQSGSAMILGLFDPG